MHKKQFTYNVSLLTWVTHNPRHQSKYNSTDEGFINIKIQPKRTKSMDMRFELLKNREAKNQF
jgi:hypothetical protein